MPVRRQRMRPDDQELNAVGVGGKRYVLLDPPDEPPLNNRYRGAEFYFENDKLYLYSSASKNPRIIVYATAEIDDASTQEKKVKTRNAEPPSQGKANQESTESASLDYILQRVELDSTRRRAELRHDEPGMPNRH